MLKNYFKIAYRNLIRNKVFTTINVLGLALGMVCVLFILQWVWDEVSVDGFHEKGDRLYRIRQEVRWDGIQIWKSTPGPLADVLREEIPEIEKVCKTTYEMEVAINVDGNLSKERGIYAEPDFLRMFTFPLLLGNKETALDGPGKIVISRHFAERYFPGEEALDKIIQVDGKEYSVTAVMENPSGTSSIQFDFIMPQADFEKGKESLTTWGNATLMTYVLLNQKADRFAVEDKIANIMVEKGEPGNKLFLEAVPDMYLYNNYINGKQAGGKITYVYLFSAIALFILLVACINFMNLTTAKSIQRAQEIGVRKTNGARRIDLMTQFMGEALVTAVLSMFIAVLLVGLLQPIFNELTGKSFDTFFLSPTQLVMLAGITFVTGILAGSYPAFFLSSLKPIQSLKGSIKLGPGNIRLRKALVVFQFTLTIALMVSTMVVYLQIRYVQEKNPGYDRENLVISPLFGDLYGKREVMKEMLLQSSAIQSVAFADNHPHNIGRSSGDLNWPGKQEGQTVNVTPLSVGYDFLETMKINLKDGRNFSTDYASDSIAYIVNEATAKLMGMEDPVGQEIEFWLGKGPIVGVVKDFHFTSMHQQIKPLVMMAMPENAAGVLIRTVSGQNREAISALEQVAQEINPEYAVEYQFLDEAYGELYKNEQLMGKLAWVATGFVIFISCLGLSGLSLFMAEQRTKEIGVRKVMGASVGGLVALLSKDFLKLVLIGFVLAVPIGFYAMTRWLESFAYRIPIEWWVFGLAGATATLIALVTVGGQSVKAALANPVDSLRME